MASADRTHLGEDAALLALGLLDGSDREWALRHVDACSPCRTEVADLAEAADTLLLAVAPVEPPPGFEASVLARLGPPAARRRPHGRQLWLLGAAAVVVVALGIGVAVRMPDGETRRTAALATPARLDAGTAWVDSPEPGLLSVSMAYDATYRQEVTLTLEVVRRDGSVRESRPVEVRGGRAEVVLEVDDPDDVRGVRMVTEGGVVVCSGFFT